MQDRKLLAGRAVEFFSTNTVWRNIVIVFGALLVWPALETMTVAVALCAIGTLTVGRMLNDIDGVTCALPRGALYLFPRIDTRKFNIHNDEQFVLDLLMEEKVLVVQGSGFNWPHPDHFRIVFLPHEETLTEAIGRIERFLATYRQ